MNKQKGIIKYLLGAILLVALFLFFVNSFGGQNSTEETGMEGGNASYAQQEGDYSELSGGMEGNASEAGIEVESGDLGGSAAPGAAEGAEGLPATTPGSETIGEGLGSGSSPSLSGGKTGADLEDGQSLESAGSESIGPTGSQGVGTSGTGNPTASSGTVGQTISHGKESADQAPTSSQGRGSVSGSSGSQNKYSIGSGSKPGRGSSDKGDSKGKAENVVIKDDDNNSQKDAEASLPEDGSYTSKQEVALYLHVYHKLPKNFITKKQANSLGWSGGSLNQYAPGKCIGGDFFGNYEGLLPTDREYHECDIDTLGAEKRGEKRLVYSNDFHIYYTEDHYKTFELLYEP